MDDCIFCEIVDTNNDKIFEDDQCYVVPDKFPTEFGHLLVISKNHYENLLVTPDDVVGHMFVVAKNHGLKLKEKLGAAGVTLATNAGKEAGQIIFHLHIHIVPKYSEKVAGFDKHKELTEVDAKKLKEAITS